MDALNRLTHLRPVDAAALPLVRDLQAKSTKPCSHSPPPRPEGTRPNPLCISPTLGERRGGTVPLLCPCGTLTRGGLGRGGLHRGDVWRAIALGLLCFLMIAPLIMAIFISFKSPSQFARVPFTPTLPLRWENYEFAARVVSQFLLNSIIVSGVTVVGVLLLSSMAAYAFSMIDFPGRSFVFYAVLALMMVPAQIGKDS